MKDENDTVYNLIWYELNHTKFWEQYLSQYCSNKQDWRKRLTLFTIVVSSIGAASWIGWDFLKSAMPIFTGIAFSIVTLFQIFVAYKDHTALTPQELQKMITLRVKYIQFFNDIEKLFQRYYCDDITPKEALDKFYEFRNLHAPDIESIKEDLNIKENPRAYKKAVEQVHLYLRPRYPSGFN